MKKRFSALALGTLILLSVLPFVAFAQDTTSGTGSDSLGGQPRSLLPEDSSVGKLPKGVTVDCMRFMKRPSLRKEVAKSEKKKLSGIFLNAKGLRDTGTYELDIRQTALSCGIKTGRIELWLAPYYLVSVIDFALLLSGLASVLFIILGGYHMIIGSYTEDKEKGKKTIMYALLGLALSILAYTIVNLLLLFLTS